MNSKAFILLGLLFAAVILEVTAVTATNDIKSNEAFKQTDEINDVKHHDLGGEDASLAQCHHHCHKGCCKCSHGHCVKCCH
ncbi:hypothetical protein Csa_020383 [Cucumis sativus]|nr:hypothetical protein Csa_020383 [Cucumis sativus]